MCVVRTEQVSSVNTRFDEEDKTRERERGGVGGRFGRQEQYTAVPAHR